MKAGTKLIPLRNVAVCAAFGATLLAGAAAFAATAEARSLAQVAALDLAGILQGRGPTDFAGAARERRFDEALIISSSGKVLSRAGMTLSMEMDLVRVVDPVMRASRGEVVVMDGADSRRVRVLLRLDNTRILYVGGVFDGTVR